MAKKKTAAASVEEGESILDILGIGGDGKAIEPVSKAAAEPTPDDRVAALVSTIEGLNTRMEQMQGDFTRLATGGAPAITSPEPVKLKELSLEGLPEAADDPEGFAKGLNTRMNETLSANMAALQAHQAESQAATQAQSNRGDQLWADFQTDYFDKLEVDLPDTITDVTPYVETAAKAVALRAVKGISDPAQKARTLDSLMYGTPKRFMDDVFAETDRVLAPLRVKAEGEGTEEHPTPAEAAGANRTGGIVGRTAPKGAEVDDKDPKSAGTMVDDIQKIQQATGFF